MSTKQNTSTDPWRGLFDPARLPPMDMRTFFVQHPDMPDFDTERWPNDAALVLKRIGFECAVYDFDIPMDVEDVVAWVKDWKPTGPGDSRIAFYGDSEAGPYFMAVWPAVNPPTQATAPVAAQHPAPKKPTNRMTVAKLALIGLVIAGVAGGATWLSFMDFKTALSEVEEEAAGEAPPASTPEPVDPAKVAAKILADAAAAGQAPATARSPAPQEPATIAVPVTTFASAGSALQLANQIVSRKTQPTLELQGNAVMPKREPLDVIGRALGLKNASAPACTIRLSDQATSVDYRMAMAMSQHFTGKVCVPHTIKVEGGRTLMEMYLKGEYAPANVHVVDLDPGVSLHAPAVGQSTMKP